MASGIHRGSWVPSGYRVSHTDLPLFRDYILKGLPLLASRDASELLVWGHEVQVHTHLWTNTASSIRRGRAVAPEWPGLQVACPDNWTSGRQDAEREAEQRLRRQTAHQLPSSQLSLTWRPGALRQAILALTGPTFPQSHADFRNSYEYR